MSYVLGIDVGKTGGYALLDPAGQLVRLWGVVLDGEGGFDADAVDEVIELAETLARDATLTVVVERPGLVRLPEGQGFSAAATDVLSEHVGLVRGVCASRGLECVRVAPTHWQSVVGLGSETRSGRSTKAQARELCSRLWPDTYGWSEGKRDAALVALAHQREHPAVEEAARA